MGRVFVDIFDADDVEVSHGLQIRGYGPYVPPICFCSEARILVSEEYLDILGRSGLFSVNDFVRISYGDVM